MKTAFRIIGFFLLVVLFAVVVPQCYLILKWAIMNIYLFKWFGIGLLAYMVVRRLLRKNEEWFATFIHELTHAMVSILFFRKIHSFHAEEGVGQMSSSSGRFGNIFITLAPYCLPILTFLFLFLRLLAAQEALFVFDILIGFTMAFHIYWFF
jgi:hypothetical protein